jgi:hypothetical protein
MLTDGLALFPEEIPEMPSPLAWPSPSTLGMLMAPNWNLQSHSFLQNMSQRLGHMEDHTSESTFYKVSIYMRMYILLFIKGLIP